MIQKRSVIGAAAFFVLAALTVGWFALAADSGGRENPLVTLDYIKTLEPQIETIIANAVRETVDAEKKSIEDMIKQARNELNELSKTPSSGGIDVNALLNDDNFVNLLALEIAKQVSGMSAGSGLDSSVTRLSVTAGQKIHLAQGSRIMIRGGGAKVNAPAGQAGLINLTQGIAINPGSSLQENHEYTVTFEAGREIECTANSIFFIWGSFN
jgi:hypothetical protein